MKYFYLLSLAFYLVVVGRCALANDESEAWRFALPNTPMPNSLRNILQPAKPINLQGKMAPLSKDDLKSLSEDTSSNFFTEKDLFSDKKIEFVYPKTTSQAKFLPHRTAKAMPFSTAKFPQILNYFSINPNSAEAKAMKETIEECEEPDAKHEDKFCAASLKALVDYAVPKIGSQAKIHATDELDKRSSPSQAYTVDGKDGVRRLGDKSVVCHKQKYVYAVFLCHEVHAKAYEVSLVGADGTKAKALAVCHSDKESLRAQKVDFEAMKVDPGSTAPLCHFLPSDDLVWMAN